MVTLARLIYRWLIHRPGYMLLTASRERLAAEPPHLFARAWLGLMLVSLGWGVAAACIYGMTWAVFDDYTGVPLMPVAALLAVTVLWPYRRAVVALARTFCGKDGAEPALGISVVVVVLALAMMGLVSRRPDWPSYLPRFLQWIPRTMFRVLILGPLWGAWAMLIVPQFCRPRQRTEPFLAEMIRNCGPLTAAACMALPLAATLFAFRVFGWWYLTIPAATILGAIVGGILLCRSGGPTRDALLADNLLTQLVFILAYLAVIR